MVQKIDRAPGVSPPQSTDILLRIIEKEREVEEAINGAKEAAQATIQEAKNRAAAILAQHRAEAEIDAQSTRDRILDQARADADGILKAAAARVQEIRSIPAEKSQRAVAALLGMLLPASRKG
jgi:vacuolar-type H+-ATPase subunit H